MDDDDFRDEDGDESDDGASVFDDPFVEPTVDVSPSEQARELKEAAEIEGTKWTPPKTLHEFQLVKTLGSGGMGAVYLYWDTKLERQVAIKFVRGPDHEQALHKEARSIAQINHPNVVAIYRNDAIDGASYIISEYIAGGSLIRYLPIHPWQRVFSIACDLARGLAQAHRQNIVHGDIKPANAMLDLDSGTAKLIDFGLARLVAQMDVGLDGASSADADGSECRPQSTVRGTPGYMAPEMVRGTAATKRSDVYAFGVMLGQLYNGSLPEPDAPTAPSPRLLSSPKNVDDPVPGLAAIVARCVAQAPEERYESAVPLLEALESLTRPIVSGAPRDNPYRGLLPFEAEHRPLFFGRDADVWAVHERLRAQHMVILAGNSGVGKSSLARAGVLPHVADGGLGERRDWHTCTLVPGQRPVRALARALAKYLDIDSEVVESALRATARDDANSDASADALRDVRRRLRLRGAQPGVGGASPERGQTRGLLIFVDQMEELVTLATPSDAELVAVVLGNLVRECTPGVRVLGAARLDYVTRLVALPGLGPLVSRALRIIEPMSADALHDTIVKPAKAAGFQFESPALVNELIDSVASTAGGLPLLQFALAELWYQRDKHKMSITRAALDRIGGVTGALTKHADNVLKAYFPDKQGKDTARALLVRMVTPDRTRARVSREHLEDGDEANRLALTALIDNRLVLAKEAEEPTCELIHETLITAWPTLRAWLDDARDTHALRARLSRATDDWISGGKRSEDLWGRARVRDAQRLGGVRLERAANEFLQASRRAVLFARIRRWSMFAIPAVVALVVAVSAYTIASLEQERALASKVAAALDKGGDKLAVAAARMDAFRSSRQRTIALLSTTGQPITREVEREALENWRSIEDADDTTLSIEEATRHAFADTTATLERAYTLDPASASSRRLMAEFLDQRARFEYMLHRYDQVAELLARLALYDPPLYAAWRAPVRVTVVGDVGGQVRIDPGLNRPGVLEPAPSRVFTQTPVDVALPPGSYVFVFEGDDDHLDVRYPVVIEPHSPPVVVEVNRPQRARAEVAFDMVYIPAGTFAYGYGTRAGDEILRVFFETWPLHRRWLAEFWIARHETTYAQWIEFLQACSQQDDCDKHGFPAAVPGTDSDGRGYRIRLERASAPGLDVPWTLVIQPDADREYRALYGEEIIYDNRPEGRARVDWRQMPVTGVTPDQVRAYLAWLRHTGKLPGARLCRTDEWERGARGADDRSFPHGDKLDAQHANVDVTYERKPGAQGPDEVGSYPESNSVFGIADMAGNVWEMTEPLVEDATQGAVFQRGGSFYNGITEAMSVNRWYLKPGQKTFRVGFRVCADGT